MRADAAVEVGGGEAGLQTDWTRRLNRPPPARHALARSVTCHGNIQSAAESVGEEGRQRRVVNSIV